MLKGSCSGSPHPDSPSTSQVHPIGYHTTAIHPSTPLQPNPGFCPDMAWKHSHSQGGPSGGWTHCGKAESFAGTDTRPSSYQWDAFRSRFIYWWQVLSLLSRESTEPWEEGSASSSTIPVFHSPRRPGSIPEWRKGWRQRGKSSGLLRKGLWKQVLGQDTFIDFPLDSTYSPSYDELQVRLGNWLFTMGQGCYVLR